MAEVHWFILGVNVATFAISFATACLSLIAHTVNVMVNVCPQCSVSVMFLLGAKNLKSS